MTASYIGMNPVGTGVVSDSAHLWCSIKDILTTPIGTRVMRRDYGSIIPELLDEPENGTTRLRLMSAAVIAIAMWESRIVVDQINVLYGKSGKVEVEIAGTVVQAMQYVNNTITLRSDSDADG